MTTSSLNSGRLAAYHIERLKDKDPQIRLKSVNELLLLEDPTCLDALEQLYRFDPDPEIRKAAQEAGKTIFLANRAKTAASS
jgi:hypothetical protein